VAKIYKSVTAKAKIYFLSPTPASGKISLSVNGSRSPSNTKQLRDGTGSGFLTRDPTRPDPVVERCETNPRQRLDSSISYLSGNPKSLVA